MPSVTAAIAAAPNDRSGNRYNGPGWVGRSDSQNVRCAGTKASATSKSWLPVPRRPPTDHVSTTVTSSAGSTTARTSLSSTRHAATTHALCSTPLAKPHRPDTRYPPGTDRAVPLGTRAPAITAVGSSA
jgi:hypothetical protein